MFHKYLLPVISLGLFCFAGLHIARSQQTPPQLPPLVEPSRNPFKASIAGSGVVEPRTENISIGSPLPGIVAELFVKVGDFLKAGDKLFQLDDRQLKAEYAVRLSNLKAAQVQLERLQNQPRPEEIPPLEAKLAEAKATLAGSIDAFQRATNLIKTRAIGDEELIQKKSAVAVAEAQVQKAEADLKLAKAGAWQADKLVALRVVEQAQALLHQTETELARNIVTAPVDGEILQRNIRIGEYAGIPPGQALIVMGDINVMHVRVDIDENDLTRFRKGLPGRAFRRGDPGKAIRLKFVRVEPFVIPKKSLTGAGTERVDTRVLQVIYAVEASDLKLFVGQQVDVYLDTGEGDSGSGPKS